MISKHAIIMLLMVLASRPALADQPTITADVAFKVGNNASIDWFEIANPSVRGTITVTNQPYPSTHSLNSAVVDIGRNRLIYMDDALGTSGPAYAFNLAGLLLVPNAATPVTVSSL